MMRIPKQRGNKPEQYLVGVSRAREDFRIGVLRGRQGVGA